MSSNPSKTAIPAAAGTATSQPVPSKRLIIATIIFTSLTALGLIATLIFLWT